MSIINEISVDIWENKSFHEELATLQKASIVSELARSRAGISVETLDDLMLSRLLQAALIFSRSTSPQFLDAAQAISTATLKIGGGDRETLGSLFALIQGRLGNYAGLSFMTAGAPAPAGAPLSLQYEFVESRTNQTITLDEGVRMLSAFQLESWNTLRRGKSATITGPTSAGKSYVVLLHIVEQFKKNVISAAAYVVPTRALINQVSDDISRELLGRGVRDVMVTSVPVNMQSAPGDKVLYVLTQERLESLLLDAHDLHLDLIVIDEAQMIAEGSRGVLLESVIDRVVQVSPRAQFVFIGPMIENPGYFGKVFSFNSFVPCSTRQSPVTQNIIHVNYSSLPSSHVDVQIFGAMGSQIVSTIPVEADLSADLDAISYLSSQFGRSGTSIVYAGGKAEAEKISIKMAIELPESKSHEDDLAELIKFVKRHVHKDYALVGTLSRGVGFHYGHMPSLLRKELEDHFKERRIHFLVCTSTLLYGLNLPAKNLFLLKPTTGRRSAISGPDFWNLAGRVGRLGKEVEGNVYLINYESWETKPVEQAKDVQVSSALRTAIVEQTDSLMTYLDTPAVSSGVNLEYEITLGKLVLDHRHGRLDRTINRYRDGDNADRLQRIRNKIEKISQSVDLPSEVLDQNIRVSIFRQSDLYIYFVKRLTEIDPSEVIPANPLADYMPVLGNYRRAFRRIHTYLLNYSSTDNRHNFFAPLAIKWMKGEPLPRLIDSSIQWHKKQNLSKSTAAIIRETMELVEDDLRFKYVKYFTCYNSILKVALKKVDQEQFIKSIPDVPLFLEMGGSSGAMINLMAIGLSRTSAESLSEYVNNKDSDLSQIREWLKKQSFEQMDISKICLKEIVSLVESISSK